MSISNAFLPGDKAMVSRLGFGCMRLPLTDPQDASTINRPLAISMIRHAIDNGVTYIDTAYGYHGGNSEGLVGEALKDGYREKVQLATKLPLWLIETREDMDRIFNEQLERLQVDYVDFYLLHAVDKERYEKVKELGYQGFLDQKIKEGKVRFPGFSFHDDLDTFIKVVDDYPWAMSQIQLNILDDDYQAGIKGLQYAADKGIKLVIMEPLRGGALANPPKEVQAAYDAFSVKRSSVEWCFRYLYNMPQVMTILSGMSTMEQIEDNLRIFKNAAANTMAEDELALIEKVKQLFLARIKTKCTACSYCQPCPQNVHIPNIFNDYDSHLILDQVDNFKNQYQNLIKEGKDASLCIACGQCEEACPQHLPIIDLLAEIHNELA